MTTCLLSSYSQNCGTWIRTKTDGSKGRSPTIRRSRSQRILSRGETSKQFIDNNLSSLTNKNVSEKDIYRPPGAIQVSIVCYNVLVLIN